MPLSCDTLKHDIRNNRDQQQQQQRCRFREWSVWVLILSFLLSFFFFLKATRPLAKRARRFP